MHKIADTVAIGLGVFGMAMISVNLADLRAVRRVRP